MTERADPTEPREEAPTPDDPSTESKEGATPAPVGSLAGTETPPPAVVDVEGGPAPTSPEASVPVPQAAPQPRWKPSYVHLAVVSIVTLALDLATKHWANAQLNEKLGGRTMDVVHGHLRFSFQENPGGAFGLLQGESESIRHSFFPIISILAGVFIISLYRKLTPQQWALKWGLPLVLGGAAGNFVNRVIRHKVVDFIDYRADWVRWMYSLFTKYPQDHWPTFNIADIAIVAGVALMAIDMFTPTKPKGAASPAPSAGGADGGGGSAPKPPAEADAPKVGSEPAAKET